MYINNSLALLLGTVLTLSTTSVSLKAMEPENLDPQSLARKAWEDIEALADFFDSRHHSANRLRNDNEIDFSNPKTSLPALSAAKKEIEEVIETLQMQLDGCSEMERQLTEALKKEGAAAAQP